MKASSGITLGTLAAVVTLMASASVVYASSRMGDMKDAREEIARRKEERRKKVVHSRNFTSESCGNGKVWIAHGHDTVLVNGQLDASEVVQFTCEQENVLVANREVLSVLNWACLGQGGLRLTFGWDTNYNRVLDAGEIDPQYSKIFCNDSDDSRAGAREAKRYWKSLDPSPI